MNFEVMQRTANMNSQKVFFELVKTGLWADAEFTESWIHGLTDSVDWDEVYRLSEVQFVQGLVLQGFEWYKEHKPECVASLSQDLLFQWIDDVLTIETQNKAMNVFVAKLIEKLRKADVFAILVKGQGIAQCYEKPLWRTSGDIDLLLDEDNYEKAKKRLLAKAKDVAKDYQFFKHIGIFLNGWMIELHGTFHGRLSGRIDKNLDQIQEQMMKNKEIRVWYNGETPVYLPKPDNDVVFVFAHILHHFFFEGVGLRQICDWCRLLWTYRKEIDVKLLEYRLNRMALMTEWKAFSAYAVEWLGMPADAMPLYVENAHWTTKAERINSFVLKVGSFGQNQVRNTLCSRFLLTRKIESLWIRLGLLVLHFRIFPKDSILFFVNVLNSALHTAYERNSKNKRQ